MKNKLRNKLPLYGMLGLVIAALVFGASAIVRADAAVDQTVSMEEMMENCKKMMGGDMSSMMSGMMSSSGADSGMQKPAGISMEEHLSHHPELQR